MKDSLESGGLNGTAHRGGGRAHLEKIHCILQQWDGMCGQDDAHSHGHQKFDDSEATI